MTQLSKHNDKTGQELRLYRENGNSNRAIVGVQAVNLGEEKKKLGAVFKSHTAA